MEVSANHDVRFYPDLDAILEDVRRALESPAAPGYCGNAAKRDSMSLKDAEWFGTTSMTAALALAETGWNGADAQIRELSDGIVGALGARVERFSWERDVEGSDFDVAAYCAGEPECMLRPVTYMAEGRRIFRIVVPIGGMAGVSANAYTAAGACAVALAEIVTRAGHESEIVARNVAVNPSGPERWDVSVIVKQAGQPVDVPRLAFVCANASYHRRLMFALRETSPVFAKVYGYGKTDYDYQTTGEVDLITLPTPRAVDEFTRGGGTKEHLLAWLREALKRAGIVSDEDHAS